MKSLKKTKSRKTWKTWGRREVGRRREVRNERPREEGKISLRGDRTVTVFSITSRNWMEANDYSTVSFLFAFFFFLCILASLLFCVSLWAWPFFLYSFWHHYIFYEKRKSFFIFHMFLLLLNSSFFFAYLNYLFGFTFTIQWKQKPH